MELNNGIKFSSLKRASQQTDRDRVREVRIRSRVRFVGDNSNLGQNYISTVVKHKDDKVHTEMRCYFFSVFHHKRTNNYWRPTQSKQSGTRVAKTPKLLPHSTIHVRGTSELRMNEMAFSERRGRTCAAESLDRCAVPTRYTTSGST